MSVPNEALHSFFDLWRQFLLKRAIEKTKVLNLKS